MKISRRDFLKGSATTLFLAGFNLPALALTSKKNPIEHQEGIGKGGYTPNTKMAQD